MYVVLNMEEVLKYTERRGYTTNSQWDADWERGGYIERITIVRQREREIQGEKKQRD